VRAGESDVLNGADGAEGEGVVEAEESDEVAGAGEEIPHGGIAEGGGPDVFLEEDAEFGMDDDAELLRDGDDGLPAGFGVEGGRQIKILGEHLEGGGSVGFGGPAFSCHRATADGCSTYGNSCTSFGRNGTRLEIQAGKFRCAEVVESYKI
jgi:hypothetical protein